MNNCVINEELVAVPVPVVHRSFGIEPRAQRGKMTTSEIIEESTQYTQEHDK